MVAFSTFMIKRFPFLWKSNSFSSRGKRNALRSPFYRRLVTHIQRRAPFVCAQGQTKNIIYVRYTGIFFFLPCTAIICSVAVHFSHPLRKLCYFLWISEYMHWRQKNWSGYNLQQDSSNRCSTSVQLPFLSLCSQRNVELIPDEGSGLGGKKKRGYWKITVRLLEGLKASSRRLMQLLSLPLTSSPPSLSHAQIISDYCSWFPVMTTRVHERFWLWCWRAAFFWGKSIKKNNHWEIKNGKDNVRFCDIVRF